MASGEPFLMSESDMIIITYFFLLRPGKYTVSKSESTLFCLKDTEFSCGQSVFAATATSGNLQSANIVTLTFTTHKNGIRKKKDTRHQETLSCDPRRTSSGGCST